ncbi:molybdenum cofactor guanylyltransferase [Cohnella hongkongensis]|uniref:Probable molybdenum cofactor guanylyltransferase n=1 Tax=Cohnella hongkongensis TaxID=178337 RepID=A0ABV9F8I7_9BACL
MLDTTHRLTIEERVSLSGVILAGGNSRTVGGAHKALLPIRYEKLVNVQLREMRRICPETILVTNEPRTFLPVVGSEVRIITDFYENKGPLGGIHAALSLASCANVWVVACDMPFVSSLAARLLLEAKENTGSEAAVPYMNERLYPLHGVYDKKIAGRIPLLFARGQIGIGSFLDIIRCEKVAESEFAARGIDSRFILNIDSPEQYARLSSTDVQAVEGQ